MTQSIVITDSLGEEVGELYWDEDRQALVLESSEDLDLISNNGKNIKLDYSNLLQVGDYTLPRVDGEPGQIMTTNGNGTVSFETLDPSAVQNLGDLNDVSYRNGLMDGYTLLWDGSDGVWVTTPFLNNLNDLDDVIIDNLQDDQYLQYSIEAGQWRNVTAEAPGAPDLGGLTDVTLTDATNGQVIVFEDDLWVNKDLEVGGAVDSVDGRTGVVTLDDLYIGVDQQTVIDSALQPNDNVSDLTNDAGYITSADIPADAVDSVDGRTGVVTLDDLYIGVSQQTVIDSALQPNDNISELTNDEGFITASDIPDSNLNDLTDVLITAPTQGQLLAYDSATGDWLNVDPAAGGGDVTSVDGRTGVVTLDDLYIGVSQQTVIDSALQPGDAVSDLDNDAGYITASDIPADAVDSVDGRTGVVTLDDLYIGVDQQTVIDSALQPNDNVSDLTNDAGYITSADIPADAVTSVDGRTGEVTLDDLYATASQGALADSALQAGADVSDLTNDAGYITSADVPDDLVTSVFGRDGIVVAEEGDYLLDQLGDVTSTNPSTGQSLRWDTDAALWRPSYSTSGLGIIQFAYRMDLPATSTPGSKDVSRNTDDPTTATILYVNRYDDEGGEDLTLFLENIKEGDWLNLYLDDDTEVFEAYDVVSDAVLNGDVFEIGVIHYSNSTTLLENNDHIRLFWRRVSQESYLEEAPLDSVLYGRKDGGWTRMDADDVSYNPIVSGLDSTDVRHAIDELNEKVEEMQRNVDIQHAESNIGRPELSTNDWVALTPTLTNLATTDTSQLSCGVFVDVRTTGAANVQLRILKDDVEIGISENIEYTVDGYIQIEDLDLTDLVSGELYHMEAKSDTVGTNIRIDNTRGVGFITIKTLAEQEEDGITEAPLNLHTYGRKGGEWVTVPEMITGSSSQEALNSHPTQGDLFLNTDTDQLKYATLALDRKMLHFDNSAYGSFVDAPLSDSDHTGLLVYFQASIEPNLQILLDHDSVGDTWTQHTRISIIGTSGDIVFRYCGVAYTYNDPIDPSELMSVAAIRNGDKVTFYRSGVAEAVIGMTEFGHTSQLATVGSSNAFGNKVRDGRIMAVQFIDYNIDLNLILALKSGSTVSEESVPAGVTLNYVNVSSSDWEDYTYDPVTRTYTPVGDGVPMTVAEGIEAQAVEFKELLTEVPVATETTFGGFKYTFVDGVLNLITE